MNTAVYNLRTATCAFFTNLARWKLPYENRLVEISRESYDILACERCPTAEDLGTQAWSKFADFNCHLWSRRQWKKLSDGHADSRSQNSGRHPALQQQQPKQSQGEDGPLAALARCGALATAGNSCTTTGKSIQHPPQPPARVATSRPSAPPPRPQSVPPPAMNDIGMPHG